jgi:O-antigen/teichoic acid export membrane protein
VSLNAKVNRGVAWAAGAQAIIAVADLVSQVVVVALFLSSDDYGIAIASIPFYTALDYIADLGISSALIQHDDHTPERVSTMFWMNMLVTAGMFVLLLGIGPLYGYIQGNAVVGWLLVAYGGKLLLQNVYAIPFALLKKEMRFFDISIARVIAHLSESAARIVFAYLGYTVWCWTLAAFVRAAVFGIIIQMRHPFLPRLVFRPREVAHQIRFGLRNAASNVLYQLYTSLDAPIVFYFFGERAAGIYGLADQIVLEPVKTIANVVTDVAFPAFAAMRSDREGLVAQLIRLTRLNLMAILPYVGVILLVIPEVLHVFYSGGRWKPAELDLAASAARILCVMGFFRALGLLGQPLLDGIGRPELTLRYMVVATIAVPASFWLGAVLLGDSLGFRSVAVAWGIGYPIAFAALAYLVVRTVDLPVKRYLAGVWGVLASCGIAIAAGFGARYLLADAGMVPRMLGSAATMLAVLFALLVWWQKITPRSIASSLKG